MIGGQDYNEEVEQEIAEERSAQAAFRRRTFHWCRDRMCGAEDCSNCYPNQQKDDE